MQEEEWRYLFIREDNDAGVNEVSWWENRSVIKIGDLFSHKLGLFEKN